MKTLLISVLLIGFAVMNMSAQESVNKFNLAKKQAQKEDKRILLVFQGSDWCASCIKLEKEILDTQEFLSLTKPKFVIVKADFPRKKKNKLPKEQQEHNNALAEKYNKNGYFPFVISLSPEGKVLGSLGYERTSPAKYFEKLNALK